ncbi:universal stress protein [Albidovulum sediminicola]|uniref:Universal stress protein n=1 Tax=Albidovulum sediminicola TaxID=2984331 RepID=A0ABT2Z0Z1_9RHOB|nr:universal stress protein [Defluviimonas sp. WL0075]MCV2864755.1 universal stress protein [Defluviimonas sp. WL0075]
MAKTDLPPIDLNNPDSARRALAEALLLLGEGGIPHVASVLQDFGHSQVSSHFRSGYEKDMLQVIGAKLGEWVAANVPEGVDVHPHVLHGTIYDQTLRAADRLSVDLIVMGLHRPELSDHLLGPNAARVVRYAKQSIDVVRI